MKVSVDSHDLRDFHRLRGLVAAFAAPDNGRAAGELLVTAAPFLGIMTALVVMVDRGYWAALVLAVPAAALLVRLFMIQHDCGHGAFFTRRSANDLTGRVIGVLTFTPYDSWRRRHAIHHATSGNLDRRGVGDLTTLTVGEYESRSPWQQRLYRLYRHPAVIFGVGPAVQFLLRHRLPGRDELPVAACWQSVLGTNLALLAIAAVLSGTVGLGALLASYLTVEVIAATVGMWLFYVQHQYDDAYWAQGSLWDFGAAALKGSSYYDLPAPLRWLTANIGFHHLHHLNSRIPFYRLAACFAAHPECRIAKRLTLRSSLHTARLALWDEEARKLVSFRSAVKAAPGS